MTRAAPFTYAPCRACGTVNRVRLDASDRRRAVCSRCREGLPVHGPVVDVAGPHLQKLASASTLPVVVDAWAAWCGPCQAFAPVFEATAQALAGQAVFAKLDTEENAQAAAQLGIRGIPTLVAFRDGREIGRVSGALPAPAFRKWLKDVASVPG
jgi:thioredoxin 2